MMMDIPRQSGLKTKRLLLKAMAIAWLLSPSIALGQSQRVKIMDGDGLSSNLLGVSAHPVRTDPTGTTNQPVTQATSPWLTSRNWTLLNTTDSVNAVQSGNWYLRLQDGSGNLITSQASGASQRALDIGIDVAGVQVDPRTRTWTLGAGTDGITATQGPAASLLGKWPTQITDGTNTMPTMDAVGRAGFHKITDGTNTAAVKAGSTAAAAADPSLVVAFSPNSPLPAGTNDIGSIDVSEFGSNPVVTGAGGSGAGIPRVTAANDSTSNANPWISTVIDGQKTTYSTSIVGLVPASTPTDVFTLTGSGTKTVRILRVWYSATEGTAAIKDILFIKRSSADSGGTSTNPTRVPYDSNDAAATATVNAYTANPTSLGSAIGTVLAFKYAMSAVNNNTAIGPDTTPIDFGNRPGRAVVLRGTSEVFAVNLNSSTSATGSLDITIEWTEE